MPNTAQFSGPFMDPVSGKEMILVTATTAEGITAAGAFSPTSVAEKALNDIFVSGDQASAVLTDGNGRLLFQVGDQHEPGTDLSSVCRCC